MNEKWMLQTKKADFFGLAEKYHIDPVIVRLMVNRGINTEDSIRRYLYGTAADEYDASQMKGAQEAAALLWEAVKAGEKIFIASDFDVDGIFSGEILWEGIREGGGYCEVRAPHRIHDGYGVNASMVRAAHADGFTTMITCDNGIAAFEAIEAAKHLGMRVIVTDHHQCIRETEKPDSPVRLPRADVIVNPHQPGDEYPFKGICGAAVAYKVMELFFRQGGLRKSRCDEFLEYVGIATVADVMEIRDENRIFVKEGLRRLGHTRNAGLRALILQNGLDPQKLTSYHIGFVIGPCFNSAGRLDTVDRAFRLLHAQGEEAEAIADELKTLNDARKLMTEQNTEAAAAWVESQEVLPDILVIPLPDCHESIAGIVAGRIRERYHHPVYVLTPGEEMWKGSGRSIEPWDMFEHMLACKDLLPRFGGHPMAAGLSIPEENIQEFSRKINENTGLTQDDFVSIIKIDAAMPLEYITEDLLTQLSLLEPFGKGNPKPIFAESKFRILSARIQGKNRNVLKFRLENQAGTRMDGIYFGDILRFEELVREKHGENALKQMYRGQANPVALGMCYYPQINDYMGVRSLQVVVTNIR